jgi:putative transposase
VIESLKKAYPVELLCKLAAVARSSYYAFKRPKAASRTAAGLLEAVHDVHRSSRGSYGSRRMALALQHRGHRVGRYRARSLMREAQLKVAKRHVHPRARAGSEARVAPNLLERNFTPGAINKTWAGDITYLRTRQGWSYLAIVMDLHSRRIIGWAFAMQADAELIIRALDQARERRQASDGVMFHSDQGCQYTSDRFVGHLKQHKMVQSMSRKGNCWDNAVVERFFRSLKSEWIGEQLYRDHEHARSDIASFIDGFYNYQRIHSAANGTSPARREAAVDTKKLLSVSKST